MSTEKYDDRGHGLWQILVPCNWNDGKPVRTRHHKEWDSRVRRISGGLTILAPGKGQWLDSSGKLFEDRVIPVSILATHEQMERIAKITIQHYKQEAVTFYLLSNEAFIYRAPGHNPVL